MMVCVGKYNKLWTCQKQKTTFNKFINTILDTVGENNIIISFGILSNCSIAIFDFWVSSF